jgi:hypothetical protein
MATESKKRVPDWLLERLALGELDDATAADVRARLAAEGRDVDAELAGIATSNRALLEAHPPAEVAVAVHGRIEARRVAAGVQARVEASSKAERRRLRFQLAPLVLGAAAAFLLFARPAPRHVAGAGAAAPEVTGDVIRIKGAVALHVYRRAADHNERLAEGAHAAPGDLLQLAYRAGDTGNFGALLSIDGRGHVTVHWPEGNADTAAPLSAKGEVKLPSAYELDDAPAFERFFLVTSEAPFAMTSVLGAARALAAHPAAARTQALPLPPALTQLALTLDKTSQETP